MCGILFQLIQDLTPVQIQQVKCAFMKIQHRGPDATNILIDDKYIYGFHRLAIVNTSPIGVQPFKTDDITLICNGEIYNYVAFESVTGIDIASLRSDVDVIGHLFKALGPKALCETLDGDFAFALSHKDGFLVARDPTGVRPLFYGEDDNGRPIAFASEAKALYRGPNVAKVSVFPPGTYYDGVSFHQYGEQPYGKEIERLLTNSVKKRLEHSDRPVALLCSGGVDSAIITSIAARCVDPTKLHVFTMQYDKGSSEDAFYAERLCNHHGYKHTIVKFSREQFIEVIPKVIETCETYDPNTVRAAIPMYLLAKHIAENTDIKVILSGEGADELFAGYLYFKLASTGAGARVLNEETHRLLRNIHQFDLLRADRCFAAFGLEVRVPYLDKDLLLYVKHLDGEYKMFENGAEKMLLRSAFDSYEDIKMLRILDRPKEKFSDGCGFSYVPDLLNYVSENAARLDEKIAKEKVFYRRIFDELYEGCEQWITARVMPMWAMGGDKGGASID